VAVEGLAHAKEQSWLAPRKCPGPGTPAGTGQLAVNARGLTVGTAGLVADKGKGGAATEWVMVMAILRSDRDTDGDTALYMPQVAG